MLKGVKTFGHHRRIKKKTYIKEPRTLELSNKRRGEQYYPRLHEKKAVNPARSLGIAMPVLTNAPEGVSSFKVLLYYLIKDIKLPLKGNLI